MNGFRRRKAWLACLALLMLAACGDDAAEGNGTDAGDGNGEDAVTWDGPEITQAKLDAFPDARTAFRADESLEPFGMTTGEFLELDRAIKACRMVLEWEADDGDAYLTELEADLQRLQAEAGGSGLTATDRRLAEAQLNAKRDELEAEKARKAELPIGIPSEYLDLVRENLDSLRE